MKPWIGIDGEGIGRTPHRYIMLARNDVQGNCAVIENPKGLSTKECLDWILQIPERSRVCGYYLNYDWTMILKDLPDSAIYRLLRPELRAIPKDEGGGFTKIQWEGYKLHFLAGMMRVSRGKTGITIWDIGKFFQAPFVDAIESWEVPAPLSDIREMKEKRSSFEVSNLERIKAYCLSECRALADLATRLERAHIDVGIKPNSWHGPGSTASAFMKEHAIDEKRGEPCEELQLAADRAFFGGRFEHSTIGRFKKVYGYDIISAYPYEAYKLPCLLHGTWRKTKAERCIQDGTHACVRYIVQDIGPTEAWGPLPCRLSNGTIVFPQSGAHGWVWLEEYQVAKQNWSGIQFGGEAWVLYKECECQPFKELLTLFRARIALGKSGRGRVTKLALNSVYGKLAQTVGAPKFASRIWAGMITSGTRAQLMKMLCRHSSRKSVLALATDGLYTLEDIPLNSAPLGQDTLGAWERETSAKHMTFVRPGIYWSDDGATVRARGIGRRQLVKREAVHDAIEADDILVTVGESTLFGGARASVYRLRNGEYRRSKHYGQWHSIPAQVSLDPRPKRTPSWGLHRLPNVESVPYSKAPTGTDAKALEVLGDIIWGMR